MTELANIQKDEEGFLTDLRSGTHFIIAASFISRMCGLLFTPREENLVLVLVPCKGIHTYGMSYPIDVAFIDSQGIVLSVYRALEPRKRRRHKLAVVVLERAAQATPWYERGDCLAFVKA